MDFHSPSLFLSPVSREKEMAGTGQLSYANKRGNVIGLSRKGRRRRRRRGRRKKFAQKWNERSVTASDNRWPVSGFAANPRIGARFIAGPAVLSNNTNYSYVNNEPGIISIPSPPTRPIQFAVTIP